MAVASYAVYVDWNGDDDFADANEDVTADVIGVQWGYGRDYASQLTGRSSAGRCTIVVKNQDGKYSPGNTSSVLYGNLLPRRKIKITMTVSGSTVTQWVGYIDAIQVETNFRGLGRSIIRGIGPLGLIKDRRVNVAMQTSVATGAAVAEVLDKIGWSATDRDIDTGQLTLNRWWTGGKVDALFALRDIEDSEIGFLRETKDGKIAFEGKHHRIAAPHTTSVATYTDAAGATLGFSRIAPQDPLKEISNIIEARIQTYTVQALATLWTLAEVPTLAAGETKAFWASYPNPDSNSQGVAVDAWTTPASTTDYTANAEAGGGGADLTASISVVATKFDTAMKIAVTNNHATTTAYLTLLQARGTAVYADDPVTVRSEDATSQSKYGERSFPFPGKFLPDAATAQDACDFLLSIYKKPISVVTLVCPANRSTDQLIDARDRDISDRVTIIATGDSKLGLNEQFFVEHVTHRLEPGRVHTVEMQLSSAADFSGFWAIGGSLIGMDTRVA